MARMMTQKMWLPLAAGLVWAGCFERIELRDELDVDVEDVVTDGDATTTDVADTESDVADADSEDVEVTPTWNACGGSVDLGAHTPGSPCGECSDGIWACDGADQVRCYGASEPNACGGCEALRDDVGATCGPCGAAYMCGDDGVICAGDEPNDCGGCGTLEGEPDASCGAGGTYVCTSAEHVHCQLPDQNTCGGTAALAYEPGTPCGTCGAGREVCDGTDTTACEMPEGVEDPAGYLNACGGCAPLEAALGDACGPCESGVVTCDPEAPDRVTCVGDAVNVCGGCGALTGDVGDDCADGGVLHCDGTDALACSVELELNACGGTAPLELEPGARCGPCGDGVHVCAAPNLVTCVGASALNACGGCGQDHATLGAWCAEGREWACDGEEFICEGAVARTNVCGGTTDLGDAIVGERCGECGTWACDGAEAIHCTADSGFNPCGECGDFDDGGYAGVGEACGECGHVICSVDAHGWVCQDSGFNACAGCGSLDHQPEEDCGLGRSYVCDGGEAVACVLVNPCLADADNCHAHATCASDWDGTFTCTCDTGYSGDGVSCTLDPTCADGEMNGDETGIDCGGSCPACEPCAANDHQDCYGGDVYWYDACDARGSRAEDCTGGEVCVDAGAEASCQCTANHTQACSDGDVYAFDSCGARGALVDDCTTDELCRDGACVIDATSTCTDGTVSGDELGRDCGGSCPLGCFVPISAGSFTMGSPATGEHWRGASEVQHFVTLTRSFAIQTTEVSEAQWRHVLGVEPPTPNSNPTCGDACPVENARWYDALAYANALSGLEGFAACYDLTACSGTPGVDYSCPDTLSLDLDCDGYRLPTEAEWEYAYRATTTTDFYNQNLTQWDCAGDPALMAIARYCANTGNVRQPSATREANLWGLYDMSGNAYEWCWDLYGDYAEPYTDPVGDPTGSMRVYRGGSYFANAAEARGAARGAQWPTNGSNAMGFRVVRTLDSCGAHATRACSEGHVYWYDTCGHREELAEACPAGCEVDACVTPPPG